MAGLCYSTQPLLAWSLNHYFYDQTHYVWAATVYYPYQLENPKSSNPHLIYGDLYQPWADGDQFDRFITSWRLSLRKGVLAMSDNLDPMIAARLKAVAVEAQLKFFAPLVYRIRLCELPESRRVIGEGSAQFGSDEVLLPTLRENEFDLLFVDALTHESKEDSDVTALLSGELSGDEALQILESSES